MADKKLSQLPETGSVSDADSFLVVQGGVSKKVSKSVLLSTVNDVISTKADASTTTAALNLKADAASVAVSLSTKADATLTADAIALKADAASVAVSLSTKADASTTTAALNLKADATSTTATFATKVDIDINSIFIDPSAQANGNGTISSPFNTWDGISWQPSKKYLQKRGTVYVGQITINADGTENDPLFIGSYGTSGAEPIIDANNSNLYAIYALSRSWIVVEGMDCRNGNSTTWGAIHLNQCVNSIVRRCKVSSTASGGISANQPVNNTFEDNTATSVAKFGVMMINPNATKPSTGNIIRGNTLTGNIAGAASASAINVETWLTGIYIEVDITDNTCTQGWCGIRTIGLSDSSSIQNNTCTNNAHAGILSIAFDSSTQIKEYVISDNICNDNAEFGIWITRAGEIVIEHNICNRNGSNVSPWYGRGIEISSSTDTSQVVGTIVRYNTCNENLNFIANGSEGVGIGLDDQSRDIRCYGNVCMNNEGAGIQVFGGAASLGGGHLIYSNILKNNSTINVETFLSNLFINKTSKCSVFDNVMIGSREGIRVEGIVNTGIILGDNKIQDAAVVGINLISNVNVTEYGSKFTNCASNISGGYLQAAPSAGNVPSNVWIPIKQDFRLRFIGTGSVIIDSINRLGVISTAVCKYSLINETNRIEYPFVKDDVISIRFTFTNTAKAEVI